MFCILKVIGHEARGDVRSACRLRPLGSRELLGKNKLGFFCSIRCPGKLIVHTGDVRMVR